jgi:hypothetical protein
MHVVLCIYMPPHLIVAASIWRATRLQVTDTSHACCFVHLHATTPHCGCFNLACNTITGDRHKPCVLFCAFTCHQHDLIVCMPPHLIVAIWRATRLQVTDTSHACCFVHASIWGATRQVTTSHAFCAFTCHQTSLWLLQSGMQHDYSRHKHLACNTITGDRHKPCMLFCAHSLWLLQSGVQHDYR